MADRRPPRREGRPASPGPRGKKFPPRNGSNDAPRPHRREADGASPAKSSQRPRPSSGPHRARPNSGPQGTGPRRPGSPSSRPRPGAGSGMARRDDAPTPRPRPARPAAGDASDRLQKVLAHAGVGSRRGCEEYILQGRITINGKVVRELGTKVVFGRDKVAVDGQPIHDERPAYIAVNKPKGYVSTNNDPSGRPRVVDLVPDIPQRVYTVGRLDEMSTGLMLLTNDGELANKLAHPKFGVEKIYRAVVAGRPTPKCSKSWSRGCGWPRGRSAPSVSARWPTRGTPRSWRWSSPRGRIARSGGCWPSSATRS